MSRDGAGQPALVTDAPARVIFPVNMPARARFRTAVSLQSPPGTGVTIRMGIADSRLYEELLRLSLEPPAAGADPWRTIDVDLGAYSGWQWSLFYHPSRITWKLVLNADATPGRQRRLAPAHDRYAALTPHAMFRPASGSRRRLVP